MKFYTIPVITLLTASAVPEAMATQPVIPQPVKTVFLTDSIASLESNYRVSVKANSAGKAANAVSLLGRSFGRPDKSGQLITINVDTASAIPPEGYELNIGKKGIMVKASDDAGAFYAIVTLGALAEASQTGSLPEGTIVDYPRFGYRGMMLDVSRNFQSKEWVKKQIDAMARLKLNNLHFHLTDGAGWRIESDSFPRLHRQAAWRVGPTWKDWCEGGNRYARQGDPNASGGYYTKQDLRDIVDYAAARHINVIPEIEMPGHSEEFLAAYPQLSCSGTAAKGENDFCAGNDSTFIVLEKILDETMDIFPSKLIHIGGDEAAKNSWKECPKCQKRMADNGLNNVEELQSYFIHRIEQYLNSKGRDMLGWDEIMEGGLAPNATVMSWRGTEGGERAAASGHRVVMTPGAYCYLDGYQDAPPTQPEAIGGYLPLEKAYSFEPVPESLKGTDGEKFIYGLQGNLFTEYVPTASHAEYMLYPRMYALAERAWSRADVTDYAGFRGRANNLSKLMRAGGYSTFDLDNEAGNRPGSESMRNHLALGAKVSYGRKPWSRYPANGDSTLTDGLIGGWTYGDGRWQAFLGTRVDCMEATVDLGEVKDIHSVSADFMQSCGADVWLPAQVEIMVSDDGENFTTLATIDHKVERTTTITFKNYGWEGNARGRYVRMKANVDDERRGVLFTDEIIVE